MKKSALGYDFKIENIGNNDPLTNQLLKARGLDESFLNPKAFDPGIYAVGPAMDCVKKIIEAIEASHPIIVVGDYDVDGTSSSAILLHAFSHEFCQASVLIPNRFTEGYGLTEPVAQRVVLNDQAMGGSSLVICVDNGTAAVNQIAYLKARGMQVIVIDHHEVKISKAAKPDVLFNPHLTGPEELKTSCAAMLSMIVAYLLADVRGFLTTRFIKTIGQLAGLATVADVMPLQNENRSLVKRTIASIRSKPIMPIENLMRIAKINQRRFNSQDIAFQIAPRLNAPGRIDTAEYTATFLSCDDPEISEKMSIRINDMNAERKEYEQSATEEAMAMIDRSRTGIIACYSPNWQKGVVGLVASRITSTLGQPSLAGFENSNGIITGSGRSIPGIDLGAAVQEALAQGLLITGGGHAMACGFSCDKRNFKAAVDLIEQLAYDGDPSLQQLPPKVREFDLQIGGSLLSINQWKQLDAAEPFGQGFPAPSFAVEEKVKSIKSIAKDGVRLTLNEGSTATIFGQVAREIMPYINDNINEKLIFGGRISLSEWNGSEKLDFFIDDVAVKD